MQKKVIIIGLLVLGVLAGVYFSGVYYYTDKFPSNLYVNDINLSGLSLKDAESQLSKTDALDKLIIKSDKEEFLEIDLEEIGYKYMSIPDLAEIFNEQNEWLWFIYPFKDSHYTTTIKCDYDKAKVKDAIESIEVLGEETSDAKLVYSDRMDAFTIASHQYGLEVTREELLKMVNEAIEKREDTLNIEKIINAPSVFADNDSLISIRDKANDYLDVELKYDYGDREEVIDKSLLKDWINIKGDQVDIDKEKVREYVIKLAREYDTYGKAREFKTSKGEEITTDGGSYGWMTHRGKTTDELIGHIKAGEDKTIEPFYSFKALIRDSDDIGDSYVEIDLKEQMVFLYIDGELKVETPTVTGNTSKGFDTPTGVYPLNYKETNAVLTGEDYASPVEYWMPFNGDVGLHDADWRTDFGGDIFENEGSHGCVNLPPANAKTIFDLVYPGMPVIVH